MFKMKKIPIGPNMSGLYLFEFIETGKRGVFVPETDDLIVGDRVELLFYENSNNMIFNLFGVVDWLNNTDDIGVGVLFDSITKEQFKLAIHVLNNVAYL